MAWVWTSDKCQHCQVRIIHAQCDVREPELVCKLQGGSELAQVELGPLPMAHVREWVLHMM